MLAVSMLLLTSCGEDEPKRKYLEYEAPIATFISAYNKGDNASMLGCFTPGAVEITGEEYSLADSITEEIKSVMGEKVSLTYKMHEKQELDENEIEALSAEYTEKYSLRLDIKKAYKLSVTISTVIGVPHKATTGIIDIITIKAGSSWYIYGDVLTKLGLETNE